MARWPGIKNPASKINRQILKNTHLQIGQLLPESDIEKSCIINQKSYIKHPTSQIKHPISEITNQLFSHPFPISRLTAIL